ncbi:MAG TPA: hypothetical protein VFY49_17630 [Myxococcota bacterium]|nr:hypothetical protein [Myxococcota bacterium]
MSTCDAAARSEAQPSGVRHEDVAVADGDVLCDLRGRPDVGRRAEQPLRLRRARASSTRKTAVAVAAASAPESVTAATLFTRGDGGCESRNAASSEMGAKSSAVTGM